MQAASVSSPEQDGTRCLSAAVPEDMRLADVACGAAAAPGQVPASFSSHLGHRLLLRHLCVQPGAEESNGGTDLGLHRQLVAKEQHCSVARDGR